jgi:hypothetical protein
MKPNRDAAAIAASLRMAANTPLQVPTTTPGPPPAPANISMAPVEKKPDAALAVSTTEQPKSAVVERKKAPETVQVTLRPEKALLNRYTLAAAERTTKTGRVVSAQEIMLEVLQLGKPQVQQ